MAKIYSDAFFNELSESLFNDIDINEISATLPEALDNNIEFGSLFSDVDNKDIECNNEIGASLKHNSLATLLESVPLSGSVPPAPHISFDQTTVFDSRLRSVLTIPKKIIQSKKYPENKKHFSVLKNFNNSSIDLESKSILNEHYADINPKTDYRVSNNMPISKSLLQSSDVFNEISFDLKTTNHQRSPHNEIERRYRQSINGKIDELRDLLNSNICEEIKSNKSAVLRRAIDRIRYLEKENECLRLEVNMLKGGYQFEENKFSRSRDFPTKPPTISECPDQYRFMNMSSSCGNQEQINQITTSAHQPTEYTWCSQDSFYQPMHSSNNIFPRTNSPTFTFTTGSRSSNGPSTDSFSSYSPNDVSSPATNNSQSPIYDNYLAYGKRKASESRHDNKSVKMGFYALSKDTLLKEELASRSDDGYSSTSADPQLLTAYLNADFVSQYSGQSVDSETNYITTNKSHASQQYFNNNHTATTTTNNNNNTITRVSLFLVSFCLFMFNPFVLSDIDSNGRSQIHNGMPIRQLYSALSFNSHHDINSDFSNSFRGFILWILYAVQWIVAFTLIIMACPFNRFGQKTFVNKFGRISKHQHGGCLAINHWTQANEDMKHASWASAASHLQAALSALQFSSHNPLLRNSNFLARLYSLISVYLYGLYLCTFRLPQFLLMFSRQKVLTDVPTKPPASKLISNVNNEQLPTAAGLRRRLLDFRFLDLTKLLDTQLELLATDPPPQECLCHIRLIFACIDDFIITWQQCNQEVNKNDFIGQHKIAELSCLGVVLGLSIKRFFGLNWIGNLILRATQRITLSTGNKHLWHFGPSDGHAMKLLLSCIPSEIFHPKKKSRLFPSPLTVGSKISLYHSTDSLSGKSLVVEEIHSELCESIVAKGLEAIIQRQDTMQTTVQECVTSLKCLNTTTNSSDRVNGYNYTIRHSSSSSLDWKSSGSDYCSDDSTSTDFLNTNLCGQSIHVHQQSADWWSTMLDVIGKWYSAHPPLNSDFTDKFGLPEKSRKRLNFLPLPPKTIMLGENGKLSKLLFLLYRALMSMHVSEDLTFQPKEVLNRINNPKCLDPWTVVCEACQLLTNDSGETSGNMLLQQAICLVANDWICHLLAAISVKRLNASPNVLPKAFPTTEIITSLFYSIVVKQRTIVHKLMLSTSIWTAHLEAIYRRLCQANPMRTRMFLLQSVTPDSLGTGQPNICKSTSDLPNTDLFGFSGLQVSEVRLLRPISDV